MITVCPTLHGLDNFVSSLTVCNVDWLLHSPEFLSGWINGPYSKCYMFLTSSTQRDFRGYAHCSASDILPHFTLRASSRGFRAWVEVATVHLYAEFGEDPARVLVSFLSFFILSLFYSHTCSGARSANPPSTFKGIRETTPSLSSRRTRMSSF